MRRIRIAAAVSGLLLAGCTAFGIREGTAEPRFTVLAAPNGLEIRAYGPRVAAETTVANDEESARYDGFRRLAHYIFGGNRAKTPVAMTVPVAQAKADEPKSETIAMTAPVSQAPVSQAPVGQGADGRQWVIRFFMPADSTLETLPTPEDPAVVLVQVPGETVAVLRFSGLWGAETIAARQAELLQRLEATAWQPVGAPVAWFYDPPWTIPFLRRNEVAVSVEEKK